jgi:hypothetical protein
VELSFALRLKGWWTFKNAPALVQIKCIVANNAHCRHAWCFNVALVAVIFLCNTLIVFTRFAVIVNLYCHASSIEITSSLWDAVKRTNSHTFAISG